MDLFGHSLEVAGELMIAYTVIRVHHRVTKEHKIDKAVLVVMNRERTVGITGILLILVGYLLQVPSKL